LLWLFWSFLRETGGFSIDSASIRTSITARREADATHRAANGRNLILLDIGRWRAICRQQAVIPRTQACHNVNNHKRARRSSGLFLAKARTSPPSGAKPSPAHIPLEPADRCPPILGFRARPSRPAPSAGDPRHPSRAGNNALLSGPRCTSRAAPPAASTRHEGLVALAGKATTACRTHRWAPAASLMPCSRLAGLVVGSIVRAAAATGRAGCWHENYVQWSPDRVGFSVSAHRPAGPAVGASPALPTLEHVSGVVATHFRR
jgi:hypothetical protein